MKKRQLHLSFKKIHSIKRLDERWSRSLDDLKSTIFNRIKRGKKFTLLRDSRFISIESIGVLLVGRTPILGEVKVFSDMVSILVRTVLSEGRERCFYQDGEDFFAPKIVEETFYVEKVIFHE